MALLLTLAAFLLWQGIRRLAPGLRRPAEIVLGILLLLTGPASTLAAFWNDLQEKEPYFPCHLCDWAAIFGGVALLTKKRWPAEMLVYWGLAATVQALITPNLRADEPLLVRCHFWLLHSGVVIAALHFVFALGFRPMKGTYARVIVTSIAYQLVVLPINLFFGANFAFQREKPAGGGLMEFLGPWPWYILGLQALGFAMFGAVHLLLKLLPKPKTARI